MKKIKKQLRNTLLVYRGIYVLL